MIKPNNYNDWTDPHTKVALGLFFVFLSIAFGYGVYKSYIASTSELRYTVIVFYEKYSDSKTNGMKVSYMAEGKMRFDNCLTMACKKIKIGERRLGYFYVDDPAFYGFLEIIVPDSVEAPKNGWKEIPEFLKPKK
ncbi:hypothetical protein ACFOUP_06975 [Belliella kenyensis]|uniref:Uncharacterized protein n=1 Tax=Belliella kenyensis TaxID=1472724 RepID=A0ABV8EJ42_9BACT|nr:hypothetical protein [Belliella kenyensis]MCH7403862.1 hypothetical protein [Belliella kenyensis]MDN3604877.1 hypothetical protein [Belliella kenyensis]